MDSYFSLTNVAAAAISFFALLCTMLFNRKSSRSNQENKTMASSLTLLAPTSSSPPRHCKHHVFPSFHGADVRTNFLSHIIKELKSKGIDVFIDNDIERSKSIGSELVEAIKGSRIAIVLLSKNYPSSTWCLNELVEIMKCRKESGQTVTSLFYEVDPTDVKKQIGDFGMVFKKNCVGKTKEEIKRWKHALIEVAQTAGFHSSNWKTEAEMIEAIATDVSNKLNLSAPCSDFDDLVGMESRMTRMRSLLQLDSDEVRKIGIWGPPGIGKTTIARSLFNRHSQNFQLSVFIDNIKRKYAIPACSDDYSVKLYLQKQFMSQLTNDTCVSVSHLGVVQDRLQDKKVLVVLDDVDHLEQVEAMAKETYWFGPGSRIIITTQDVRVLRASGVKHIHRVNLPSYDEALEIFCMYAFGQKWSKDGFTEHAFEVISLVGKLPLGLRVMGSYFRGMFEQDWIEALPKLRTHLSRNREILNILKFSYDALHDEDKSFFLHIACFFNSEPVYIVEACLAKCFLDVTQGIRILVEKSLISIEAERLKMSKLLIQLGRQIVQNESVSEPGKRRFLNDASDIGEVLSDDKAGNSCLLGINLDEDDEITWTSEKAFERLCNLRFLRILGKCVYPQSMNYISEKLRVLIWPNFKMTCFPSGFNPKFLVMLYMRKSKLEKLWDEIRPLKNLKWMDLSYSKSLKELPDLSTATNLQKLDLKYCSSLMRLPSSIGNTMNLEELNLAYCSSLVELPSSIGNAINLKRLNLRHCSSMVELPSSIGNAINLKNLYLSHCSSLVELPSSIGNAINLKNLYLSHCSSMVELPSSIGNAINLKKLDLSHCSSMVELPSSIGNAINLKNLDLNHCSSMVELPSTMRNLGSLSKFELEEYTTYHESSTEIQELDLWIRTIPRLHRLVLYGMKKLVSLPPLPDSLLFLDAENCESLERLDCSFRNPDICLNFRNCFKLNQQARDLIVHTPTNKYAVFPAEEVPMRFTHRSSGSSLIVKLNQFHLGKSTKFKACILCAGEDKNDFCFTSVCCSITSRGNPLTDYYKAVGRVFQGHLCTFEVQVETEEVTSTELVFEFKFSHSYTKIFETWEIKECGVLQLLEVPLLSFRDGDEYYETSDSESSGDGDEYYEPTDTESFGDSDEDYEPLD